MFAAIGPPAIGKTSLLVIDDAQLGSDSEPIAGRIREPGGRAHEFAGYMSLIEPMERLRRPPESRPSTSPPPEGLSHTP